MHLTEDAPLSQQTGREAPRTRRAVPRREALARSTDRRSRSPLWRSASRRRPCSPYRRWRSASSRSQLRELASHAQTGRWPRRSLPLSSKARRSAWARITLFELGQASAELGHHARREPTPLAAAAGRARPPLPRRSALLSVTSLGALRGGTWSSEASSIASRHLRAQLFDEANPCAEASALLTVTILRDPPAGRAAARLANHELANSAGQLLDAPSSALLTRSRRDLSSCRSFSWA